MAEAARDRNLPGGGGNGTLLRNGHIRIFRTLRAQGRKEALTTFACAVVREAGARTHDPSPYRRVVRDATVVAPGFPLAHAIVAPRFAPAAPVIIEERKVEPGAASPLPPPSSSRASNQPCATALNP